MNTSWKLKFGAQRALFLLGIIISTSACNQLEGPALLAAPMQATIETKLTAPEPSEYAFFGDAVAIDGRTAVVGAWGEDDESGAAYVYVARNGRWILQDTLRALDLAPGERFGHAVAIHGDMIVVGAVYDGEFGFRAGAAYLFVRKGSSWQQYAKLIAPDAGEYHQFGSAVAISGDTIAVGASGFPARAIHLFDRAGVYQETLRPSSLHEDARFGSAVAMSGAALIAGAWQDEPYDDEEPRIPGAAYLFARSVNGWQEVGRFTSASGKPEFGFSVAMSGNLAAVGTPGESVELFSRQGDAWQAAGTLREPAMPHFGASIALDGNTMTVGAPGGAGAVALYRRSGNGWAMQQRVMAADAHDALHFGGAVASSGKRLIVGATGSYEGGVASGAVYFMLTQP